MAGTGPLALWTSKKQWVHGYQAPHEYHGKNSSMGRRGNETKLGRARGCDIGSQSPKVLTYPATQEEQADGRCYRHILALQPQSNMSIKPRASKSLKVLFHSLKEQGKLITSSPRSSPWKTIQNWSKLDHKDCSVLRVWHISLATCKKCDAYWKSLKYGAMSEIRQMAEEIG